MVGLPTLEYVDEIVDVPGVNVKLVVPVMFIGVDELRVTVDDPRSRDLTVEPADASDEALTL